MPERYKYPGQEEREHIANQRSAGFSLGDRAKARHRTSGCRRNGPAVLVCFYNVIPSPAFGQSFTASSRGDYENVTCMEVAGS